MKNTHCPQSFLRSLLVFFKIFRQSLLITSFGFLSECKHSPTCGDYFLKKTKSDGLFKGLFAGAKRIINCV